MLHFFLCFVGSYYVVLTDLEFSIENKMVLNSQRSVCLQLLGDEMKGVTSISGISSHFDTIIFSLTLHKYIIHSE